MSGGIAFQRLQGNGTVDQKILNELIKLNSLQAKTELYMYVRELYPNNALTLVKRFYRLPEGEPRDVDGKNYLHFGRKLIGHFVLSSYDRDARTDRWYGLLHSEHGEILKLDRNDITEHNIIEATGIYNRFCDVVFCNFIGYEVGDLLPEPDQFKIINNFPEDFQIVYKSVFVDTPVFGVETSFIIGLPNELYVTSLVKFILNDGVNTYESIEQNGVFELNIIPEQDKVYTLSTFEQPVVYGYYVRNNSNVVDNNVVSFSNGTTTIIPPQSGELFLIQMGNTCKVASNLQANLTNTGQVVEMIFDPLNNNYFYEFSPISNGEIVLTLI